MKGESMTNEQINKVLEKAKTIIAKKCDTVDEVIAEIENIQNTQ